MGRAYRPGLKSSIGVERCVRATSRRRGLGLARTTPRQRRDETFTKTLRQTRPMRPEKPTNWASRTLVRRPADPAAGGRIALIRSRSRAYDPATPQLMSVDVLRPGHPAFFYEIRSSHASARGGAPPGRASPRGAGGRCGLCYDADDHDSAASGNFGAGSSGIQRGTDRRRPVRLPRLPQARHRRQSRAGAEPDAHWSEAFLEADRLRDPPPTRADAVF